ncbi:Vgb family protein [Leifsonia shinshuensis]|uniref:Virginiamycin B lyase n=1 Tax=Leifsonia shinshuensis TaxID=150026 RepID=A0A7G6YAE7_9MICO|nr:virginiamycin B lyase [Leifsonia shinshuensis]QNE35462.1 virginiamycin B lyase [Leifsonia shinshuensis]
MSGEPLEVIPVGEPGEGPYGIAVTDDGAVWFTLVHGAAIGRLAPDGTLTRLDLGAGAQPSVVAAANASDVWVSDTTGGRLLLVGPGPRLLAEAAVPTTGAQPFGVTALYDGTTWFTELAADALGRVGVLGQVDEFPVGREGTMPSMIAASGDSLWFTMNAIDALGHVRGGDAAVAVTELPAGSGPVGIAVAEDGAVWSALIGADALARVGRDGTLTLHPLGAGAKPHAVAADATGGVWVSLWGADALAHVTAGGETARVPLPAASEPHGIAVAADGTVWSALESGALARLRP